MANTDKAFGFIPVAKIDGSQHFGLGVQCVHLAADNVALFPGDVVKLAGTGVATPENMGPAVVRAAAGDVVLFGVVVSLVGELNTSPRYGAASTLYNLIVMPFQAESMLIAQEDSDTSTLALTDIGSTIDLIVAAGNTTLATSGMELDSSTVSASGSGQFRIIGLAAGSEVGANANWIVTPNEFVLSNGSVGV